MRQKGSPGLDPTQVYLECWVRGVQLQPYNNKNNVGED